MHHAPADTLFVKPGMMPIPTTGAKIYNLVSEEKTNATDIIIVGNPEA
jgi:hypothetical protein